MNARFNPALDMRYKGQSFHLPVPYENEEDPTAAFRTAFKKRYGYCLDNDHPLEVVAVRLCVLLPREKVDFPENSVSTVTVPMGQRDILLLSGLHSAPVFERKRLHRTFFEKGPLVIQDEGATVLVPTNGTVAMEACGCLKIKIE